MSVFELILVCIQSECGKMQTRITPKMDTPIIQKQTQLTMIFLTRNKWLPWERNNNSKAEAVVWRCSVLKKRLWRRCFAVNFVKFLKTPFFIEHLWWLLLARKTCSSAECFWNFRNNFTSKNHAFSRSLIILIQAFVCIIIYIKWGWTFCLLLDTRYVLLVVSWYLLFSCSILRISLLFSFVSGNIKLLLVTFHSPFVILLLSHYLLPLSGNSLPVTRYLLFVVTRIFW